jgi:hypothetical protein
MDYSIDKTSTHDDNNDKKLTFEDIAPRWSKRLTMLTVVKGSFYEKESIFSDTIDYKTCIVGESYGFSPSYALYGSVNHCMICISLSREFVYATKMSDLAKLTDAKQKLTEHWNETHSDILGSYIMTKGCIGNTNKSRYIELKEYPTWGAPK